jgi:dTDP-4-amino-4,6-dideoxygalactose transaminase
MRLLRRRERRLFMLRWGLSIRNPCDEVITTPMSDMGTVIPILSCNCVPVFADVDPVTGNLTAETIAKTITPKTKAVIVVHLFGRPAKMDSICKLLSERGIALIEDCAQAHYAEYKGQKVGTFGDFGCFSLQSSKQITCGDGGMTLVNTEKYSERASLFADKGFDRKRSLSTILFLAPNYWMTELQAAVGRCQLRRLPGLIRSRQQSAEQLRQALQDIPQIILPEDTDAKNAWWRFTFGVDERAIGVSTMDFVEALKVEGVKTSKEFPARPLFAHDLISKQQTYGTSRFPFSKVFYEQPMLDNFPGFKEFAGRMIPIGWSSQVKPRHVDSIDAAIRKVVQALVSSRSKSSAAVPVAG